MIANSYSEYYEQDFLWGNSRQEEDEKRLRNTALLIPDDVTSILDVGCGDGIMLNYLERQGKYGSLVGSDSSLTALKYVKSKKVLASIEKSPFSNAIFDLVLCLQVLEHLPCGIYQKALEELQRISKKYIIISIPNNEDIRGSFVACPECGCEFSPHRHLRSFDEKSLSALLPDFKLIRKTFSGFRKQYVAKEYLKKLGRFCGLVESFPKGALCPQCGFFKERHGSSEIIKRGKFPTIMNSLIPYKKGHRWLIALFLRNEIS